MRVLDDEAVAALATPELVREAMHRATIAAWRGELVAPPRGVVPVGDRRLTFTCGGVRGGWYGYRSYVAPGSGGDDQVVVVHDESSGAVEGVAVGRALGPRRVGGIGAAALSALAPPDPGHIALVGAGLQAWHQLWALPERFRDLPVHVASRTVGSREDFAARARRELDLDVRPMGDPRTAVRGAGIVVLATSSATPVIDVTDVTPGAYVATLGPKQTGRAEFAPDLATGAALVVSDSPDQVAAYDPPNVLVGTPAEVALVHLGAVLAGEHPVPEGRRVFFSVGLAGTEAWLLRELVSG